MTGQYVEVDGTRIHLRIEGREAGPWVVLIHSIGSGLGIFDEQIAELGRRYRLLRYDIRGHGKSDAPAGPYTIEQLAADLLGLFTHFAIARADVIGVSIGAQIALAAAMTGDPRIARIAVCNCRTAVPPDYDRAIEARNRLIRERGIEAIVEPMLKVSLTPATIAARPDLAEKLRGILRETSVEGFAACTEAVRTNRLGERLDAIKLPVLFVAGDEDTAFPPAAMREMQAQIPASQFEIVPASAHISNFERPDVFNAVVQRFLDGR